MMPQNTAPRAAPGARRDPIYSRGMASEGGKHGDRPESAERLATARSATADGPETWKLRRIEITNYKALDHLELDIPAPLMPGDPDIFVVGSKNGVGKTSLLECCALGYLGKTYRQFTLASGAARASIRFGSPSFTIETSYDADRASRLTCADVEYKDFLPPADRVALKDETALCLFGRSLEPLAYKDLLMFHSYRKVSEGSLQLQEMLNSSGPQDASMLKMTIVGMMLAKSGLLENYSEPDSEARLEQLNQLLYSFAGGRVDKLRTMGDNRLDIRITKQDGTSFSFDALSSGQKEIISTFFLIWNATRTRPALVLIDEPELHLNAEWQREFIRQLHLLAPHNQYILATHSEEIFASVPEERRVLLVGPQG